MKKKLFDPEIQYLTTKFKELQQDVKQELINENNEFLKELTLQFSDKLEGMKMTNTDILEDNGDFKKFS